jgi:hypothetical protein
MKKLNKKYRTLSLLFIAVMSPVIYFMYEFKKLAGIKDLFDIEDDNEL